MLLRHVVSSMPVHVLSVVQAPKTIHAKIHRRFSNFFGDFQIVNARGSRFLGFVFAYLSRNEVWGYEIWPMPNRLCY